MNYLNSKNLIGALFVRDTNDKPLKLVTAFKKATKTTLIIASAILTITILGTNATAAPVIDVAPPTYNIFEGDTVILDGLTTFVVNTTDNPHSATVDWGEGAGPVAATVDDALGEIYGSNIYEDEGIGSYSSQICVLNSVSEIGRAHV